MANLNLSGNQKYYNTVALKTQKGHTLKDRLERGATAEFSLDGEGEDGIKYITKWAAQGSNEQLLENELQVFRLLVEEKAQVPILHENSLYNSGSEEGITMQLVNNAASLGDYAEAYVSGEIPIECLREVIITSKEAITTIHKAGVIHNDLHANNVIISLVNNKWKAYVIDFGWSYIWEDGIPEWIQYERNWLAEDQEEDLKHLQEDLEGRLPMGYDDPDFLEVTALLDI